MKTEVLSPFGDPTDQVELNANSCLSIASATTLGHHLSRTVIDNVQADKYGSTRQRDGITRSAERLRVG